MNDIQLRHVCKAFDGRILFDDLNLTLKSHAVTCVTGASGCGKTTLTRMLMGLERPDSGDITGIDRINISVVFQEDRLCEALSASANAAIALNKGTARSVSDSILIALGLENELCKPVSAMSGGMRRRVAIARALASQYDLLILDEPFTGLDVCTRNQAIECLHRFADGKTVLLVTHDPYVPGLVGGDILNLEAFSLPQM